MILPDTLNYLTSLDRITLARILDKSGYPMHSFQSSKFVGLTTGGEFCYKVTFFDEAGTGENEVSKVFIKYDNGALIADF